MKAQAIRGVIWGFLDRIGQQGISFVITMILARLLAPAQFGLVGMLTIFMEVAGAFVDSGFSAALIQKKEVKDIDICSAFYVNVLTSLAAMGLLYVGAPWVAAFYHQPILTSLLHVLSLKLVIGSLACVHSALLWRRIDFKTQLKMGLVATPLSGALGIVMALQGFGVWSLVTQYLTATFLRSAFLWIVIPWRPRLVFSLASVREMFGFGSRLLASGLLNTFFEDLYLVVIGRLFSATSLGLYNGARRIQTLATTNTTTVVTHVAFPVFSRMQDDPLRLKRSLRKAMTLLALIHFPVMMGLALVAQPLVNVLLSPKWAAAAPWLQLLCLVGATYPHQALLLNLLKAKGRSDLFFNLEVFKKILTVLAIVITYRWGVVGLLWGQITLSALGYYINSYYVVRLVHYSLKEQLADLAPYAGVSALMGLGVYLVQLVSWPGATVQLLAQVLLGIALYATLSYVFGLPALLEAVHDVRDKLRSYTLSPVRS
ncbi:MAG: oligosaccharide flippase family protein [Planctomycetes bacterium]|nr:oligosaccharide flippase family protein [Planctomycetota bacterium]